MFLARASFCHPSSSWPFVVRCMTRRWRWDEPPLVVTDLYRHLQKQEISIILSRGSFEVDLCRHSKKRPVWVILGANLEAVSVPIIGHPVSAILGAKHEAESGPITGDTGYSWILDPAILWYSSNIEDPLPSLRGCPRPKWKKITKWKIP